MKYEKRTNICEIEESGFIFWRFGFMLDIMYDI